MNYPKLLSVILYVIIVGASPSLFAEANDESVLVLQAIPKKKLIRTIGTVEKDDNSFCAVRTMASGWVEKSYLGNESQKVTTGQILFDFVSPERYGLEVAYLMALDKQLQSLTDSIRERLNVLGVTDDELVQLTRSRQAQKSYPICAPVSGVIRDKALSTDVAVDQGELLCRICDDQAMTLVAKIYEQDRVYFTAGKIVSIELPSLTLGSIEATVTSASDTPDPKTRAYNVSFHLPSSKAAFEPGTLSIARIEVNLAEQILCVPERAILRNQASNCVEVINDRGQRLLRTVILGPRLNDGYEVLEGLVAGEKIVLHTT